MPRKRRARFNQESSTAMVVALMSPLVYVMAYAIMHTLR